ncbi:MAG: COX15/CtaA family protein [Pseudomonadota bacterium]
MYRSLVIFATVLTLAVVVIGAYVRLSDAGLGCPDWPGCYGRITPLHAAEEIAKAVAAQGGEHGPVSMPKAWKEMIHRYVAGFLGLLLLGIAALAWTKRRVLDQSPGLPLALLAVVVVQATLGMWTVTLLLKPVIVTLHLVGGMTILAMLTWLAMRQLSLPRPQPADRIARLRPLAIAGLALVALQIILGGWVSSNYAALACPDLPLCRGELVPPMDFANAFHIVRELGMTPEGELLSIEALTAIHWMHRVGALVVTAFTLYFVWRLYALPAMRGMALLLLAVLALQFTLGVLNVALSLPLLLAAAHNAGAAALLVVYVVLNFLTHRAAVSRGEASVAVPSTTDRREGQ